MDGPHPEEHQPEPLPGDAAAEKTEGHEEWPSEPVGSHQTHLTTSHWTNHSDREHWYLRDYHFHCVCVCVRACVCACIVILFVFVISMYSDTNYFCLCVVCVSFIMLTEALYKPHPLLYIWTVM